LGQRPDAVCHALVVSALVAGRAAVSRFSGSYEDA